MTRYRTIVADPPWEIRWSGGGKMRRKGNGVWYFNNAQTGLPYATMTLDEIAALPVGSLAEDDAHLYLWTTDELLLQGDAARVVEAWGFQPLRTVIWAKPNFGLGAFPRPQHEPIIVARRGALPFGPGGRKYGSVQTWRNPRRRGQGRTGKIHSAKPDGALDMVEAVSPGPYLELFARRARFGWDYWGDESLSTAEMPAA